MNNGKKIYRIKKNYRIKKFYRIKSMDRIKNLFYFVFKFFMNG
tara:strand:+ start:448 stop:576 length:129 start_codon:yes stop_codon:yes gene_type:complete